MIIALFLLAAVALVVAAVRLRSREILPPADPAEVRRLASAGQKIEAIRMYRRITGMGLYDANQAIEKFQATGVLDFTPGAIDPAPAPDEEVAALVRDNRLIEAIKVYREKHGVDLLTAKKAVEKLAGR